MKKRNGAIAMEKWFIKEISKNLNWNEIIIVKAFRKTCFKVYKEGCKKGFNFSNKNY